jgi:SulP family sulfate permease
MAGMSANAGDLWGGLAAMLVALPSAIAFGVLVYAAIDPAYASQGALYGMLGAAALGLVAPLVGRTPALVTAPCAPAAAILAALALELQIAGVAPERIIGLLGLTGLCAAVLLISFGLVNGGRFIKYIPYPVVSGYLSGVGLIIAISQLPNVIGLPGGSSLLTGLADPDLWRWQSLAVGGITVAITLIAPRVSSKLPAVILGLAGGVVAYLLLGILFDPGMLIVTSPLLIGPVQIDGSVTAKMTSQVASLWNLELADLVLIGSAALTLAGLLAIDTLKTCVVLDALTGNRHRSNRELIGQGAGNLAAFISGGMAGAGTMGPTLVNVTSGATTWRSGLLAGLLAVLVLLVLSPLVAWVPLAALAGILLVVAVRMIDWSAISLLRHSDTRLDFAVIATVVVVAETVGLIAASAAGVALAIMLFIRDQIRGSVLRSRANLTEVSSRMRRTKSAREILRAEGELGLVVELQGNLFFGTTDQLFTELDSELGICHWMLLDMRRVQSLDYTAANLLRQMQGRLEERDGALLLCGLPSHLSRRQDIQRYLAELGLFAGESIQVFETRDEGLEWMEDRILEIRGHEAVEETMLLELAEMEFLRDLDAATLDTLRQSVEPQGVSAGARIFGRGDSGDELYLVRRGSVRILLPLAHGKQHHLATFGPGDFFGEMAFLDREPRSADAVAKTDCDLYVLSRAAFDEQAVLAASVSGARLFERLARVVSRRLRDTDRELRAIEDR